MKKNLLHKLLVLVLALAMLCSTVALTSCGGEDDPANNPANTTQAGGTTEGDAPMTGEELEYLPKDVNYKNREFIMAAPQQNIYGTGHYCHLEGSEDIIDRALHARELLMQDFFGVIMTLDTTRKSSTEILAQHNKTNASQKAAADVMFINASDSMTAAIGGSIWNLNVLDELNLDASYYDQRIQQNFRIGDMLFQITGDYEVLDELVTFGVLYNDTIYDDLGYYEEYGTPYQMVRDYEWTYDAMMTMAASFTAEFDGVDGMSQNDKWGVVSETQAVYYFYMGSGIQPMSSINGELKINLDDATTFGRTIDMLQVLLQFTANENVITTSQIVKDDRTQAEIASDIFEEDHALFRTTSLSDALYCNEMESDFGILPVPMYDAAQRAYYNQINADAAWPLCIPFHVDDVHKVANIVELISYYSRYGSDSTLYEEFFERLALAKICRKPDDRAMMELVFSTKVYCIDTSLTTGSTKIRSLVIRLAGNPNASTSLSGTLQDNVDLAKKALPAVLGMYEMNNSHHEDSYNG